MTWEVHGANGNTGGPFWVWTQGSMNLCLAGLRATVYMHMYLSKTFYVC